MKKAIRRVLAYVHIHGHMPSHIHAGTYCDALPLIAEGYPYTLTPAAKALMVNDPVILAHEWALSMGYTLKPVRHGGRGRSTHHNQYDHSERDKRSLVVYRDKGFATIWAYDLPGPPYTHIQLTNSELLGRTEP